MVSSEYYSFWIPVTHAIPQVGFVSSMTFGSILLFLNYIGAQRYFGSYKYLISAITILGMLFSAAEILVYPVVHNHDAGALFFSFEESLGLHSSWNRNFPLAGYTFFHAATMSVLSVQFIYRYWAVFDSNKLKYFKGTYAIIWLLYCTHFGLQYSLGIYYFLARDSMTDEYFREELLLRYNANIAEVPAMAILAYDSIDGTVRWGNLMGILNICLIVNIQYTIMAKCGRAMQSKMEEKIKVLSEALRKRHKQFFKVLIIQLATPTIILFLPITTIICLPIFNLKVTFPAGAIQCSFTLYPAMDSLIVMYVVSEYRLTARKIPAFFCKRFEPVRPIKISTTTSQPI